jgi:hypothetical protein
MQIVAAFEAVHYYKHKNYIFVVRYGVDKISENNLQMSRVLKCLKIKNIWKIKISQYALINHAVEIFYSTLLFFFRATVKSICIGDWRSVWMHRWVEVSKIMKPTLVDDGLATIFVLDKFLSKGIYSARKLSGDDKGIKNKLRSAFYSLLSGSRWPIYEFDVFSSFCNETDSKNVRVIPNEYKNIRALTHKKKISNEICHFGSKYSEAGLFDFEVELLFLENVFNYLFKNYPFNEIFYIPHRNDSDLKLMKVIDLGFKVKRFGVPAEIYYLLNDTLPSLISTAYSTAGYNLSKMFEIRSTLIFKLPLDKIGSENLESVNVAYEFYKKKGFDIINLF